MWGFIPQDLLDDLHRLTSPIGLEYFVDGTPVYYHYDDDDDDATSDKKLLIFGERRGGYHYTALDISNYNAPILKYSISPDILGSDQEQLGQSWATPQALEMAGHVGFHQGCFPHGRRLRYQPGCTPHGRLSTSRNRCCGRGLSMPLMPEPAPCSATLGSAATTTQP